MKKELIKLLVLFSVAMGAGPLGAAIWQWSLTPANNGIADPTINWAVGMAPSAVDPSARAMMARIAEWRDDTSGSLTLGGGPTAFTLTTNQSNGGNPLCPTGGNPASGTQVVALAPTNTNNASATLAVDGCTVQPIIGGDGTPLAPNRIHGVLRFSFYTPSNSWLLQSNYQPSEVPIGAVIDYAGLVPPNNYIFPFGQCLSQTAQNILYAQIGSPGVGSCSAGQFNAPDIRGRVVAMLDSNGGQYGAASRLTSAATGCGTPMSTLFATCANGSESVSLGTSNMASYTPSGGVSVNSITGNIANGAITTTTSTSVNNGAQGLNPGNIIWEYNTFGNQDSPCCLGIGLTSSSSSSQGTSIWGFTGGSASFAGNNNGGTSTAFSRVQPMIGLTKIMRIN